MYDNRFFNGIGLRVAVYLSALVVGLTLSGSLKAENVPLPPPMTTTAAQTQIVQSSNGKPIVINSEWRGHTPITVQNGVLNVPAQPKTQFGNATATTATKANPIRITDPYGNVTRTQVTTQTQLPQKATMSKTGAALMGTAVVGGTLNSQGANIGSMLAQGDYKGAGQAAVEGLLQTLKGMGNFVTGGLITGVESAVGGYNAEKQRQSMAGAVQAAAQAKAERAAAMYEPLSESKKKALIAQAQMNGGYLYRIYLEVDGVRKDLNVFVDSSLGGSAAAFVAQSDGSLNKGELYGIVGDPVLRSYLYGTGAQQVVAAGTEKISIEDILNLPVGLPFSDIPTVQDFMLNANELAQVLQPLINQMLNNANANHTELINALSQLGALPANTPANTSVVGTAAENTVVSTPYTPVGTNQAQQTQHVINRDGSITTSYIPRPDLGAGSSLAPVRSPIGKGKSKLDIDFDDDSDDKKPQKVEICTDKNAEKVLCLPAGSDDYEDLNVPHENETLAFEKKNYFARNAACPAPMKIYAFGMSMEISYEPWCDMARGIRPIIEFLGVLTAMSIAYGAVREL